MFRRARFMTVFNAAILSTGLATSALASQQAKLLANDAAIGNNLGWAVGVSGDTAIAGAPFASTLFAGAAYIYTRTGTTWSQQAKLTAADASSDDNFGHSVAISGNTVVVGAPFDDNTSVNAGSVYIFTRTGTAWSLQAKLTAFDEAFQDNFGFSVAISGDTVIVGTPFDDDDTTFQSGSAYIFARSGTVWTLQNKITASDAASGDQFGYSVSIENDTAIAGANKNDDTANDSGSAYVFTRTASVWTQQAKLTAGDPGFQDQFGLAVSISGESALVGAFFDDDMGFNSGSAYVFNRQSTTWSQQAKLTASDGISNNRFGISVSISGNTSLVGAFLTSNPLSSSGSAYVYTRSGTSWKQRSILAAADAAAGDQFGWTVSLSGDTALAGAPFHDDVAGAEQGSAYVFNVCKKDLTGDGTVDGADLGILLGNWGNPGISDLTGDGTTDGADLGLLLGAWGPCL